MTALLASPGLPLSVMTRLPSKPGASSVKRAVLVDRIGNAGIDPALLEEPRARRPELEILAPVARRGVNEARARVFRHMVAVEQRNDEPVAARMERMGANHRGERSPSTSPRNSNALDLGASKTPRASALCDDVGFADPGPVVSRGFGYTIAPVSDPA